jgi:hypothetical protein
LVVVAQDTAEERLQIGDLDIVRLDTFSDPPGSPRDEGGEDFTEELTFRDSGKLVVLTGKTQRFRKLPFNLVPEDVEYLAKLCIEQALLSGHAFWLVMDQVGRPFDFYLVMPSGDEQTWNIETCSPEDGEHGSGDLDLKIMGY